MKFRKSSKCQHADCVEVCFRRCEAHNCVEVGVTDSTVLVRDSKLPSSDPMLVFTGRSWNAFLMGLKNNEF